MERTRTAFHPLALHFYLYLNSTGKHLICCEKEKENETTHWKIVKFEKADRDSTQTCHRQLGGQEGTTGGWYRPLEIHQVSADLVLMSRIELTAAGSVLCAVLGQPDLVNHEDDFTTGVARKANIKLIFENYW